MEDLKKKNITIDAMEDDDNYGTKPVVKNTTFDAKNYLNVRLDVEKGEFSKELKIRLQDAQHQGTKRNFPKWF